MLSNLPLLVALTLASAQNDGDMPPLENSEKIAAAAQPADKTKVPEGMHIPVIIDETLSTKTHATGDNFAFHVSDDVVQCGDIVIPKGTRGIGELYLAETKGAFGKSGKLEARMLYIELADRTVRVNGSIGASGKGATTEAVATAILAGTIAFAITGKSATIEKGSKLDAQLEKDIWVVRFAKPLPASVLVPSPLQ